jgi:LysR family tcuABC transcriptional regulator
LILPTGSHGLRSTLESAFARAKCKPHVVAEIDSLAMLMDAVDSGLGCTVQPWAAVGRYADAAQRFKLTEISDTLARRATALCSLSDDELSPAALAARVVLADCAREAVRSGRWVGARLTG